ncbi:MAG: hypothetical protein ACO331_10220 [Prochlorothrix sp.]
MSFDELTPLLQELAHNPVAFLGGFMAGALRLDLSEDPVKSWLEQQGGAVSASAGAGTSTGSKKNGPQSISID